MLFFVLQTHCHAQKNYKKHFCRATYNPTLCSFSDHSRLHVDVEFFSQVELERWNCVQYPEPKKTTLKLHLPEIFVRNSHFMCDILKQGANYNH